MSETKWSEKDCVLPRRNSGRRGLRTPEAQFGAKRTAYSRGAIRSEEDCVLPRRNSGEAQFECRRI
ncbi:hypothetical protein [Methanosarcina sp. DH2]|uniref:hypothetical protein n=1 Tax=Methanosarcina sp. DH2 TaxID=2605639 RepID=UPI001E2DF041|nr:hypothetical protein [Methanosarcina sp. DH2]